MKLNLKKAYEAAVSFVKNNPDIATTIGLAGPILIKAIKSGKLVAVGKAIASEMAKGSSFKVALKSEAVAAAAKSLGIAAAKVASIAAASAFAYGTVKQAVTDAGKSIKDPELTGWEKLGHVVWKTWIPVATVNQIRSFFSYMSKSDADRQREEEGVKEQAPIKEGVPLDVNSGIEGTKEQIAHIKEEETGGHIPAPKTTSDQLYEYLNRRKELMQHPEWYGRNKELLTVNLNYGVIKGFEPEFDVAIGSKVAVALTVPMRQGQVSQAYKDKINELYVDLRGPNSGSFNYDAEDVAAYIECVRGMRATLKTLQRDFKLVNQSEVYKELTPDIYLEVAGYNATGIADLKANKAIYQTELNLISNTLRTRFPMFPGMAVNERTDYISECILKESSSEKACFIVFAVDTVLTPTGTDQQLAGVNTSNGNSFAARLATLQTLINNMELYTNPNYKVKTFTKIAGDIKKCYKAKALLDYGYVHEEDKATIVYDEYLLHQLQNTCSAQWDSSNFAFVCGTTQTIMDLTATLDITVPGNSSHTLPVAMADGLVDSSDNMKEIIINTNKDTVSCIETLSLTRSCYTLKVDASTITYGTATAASLCDCGADIFRSIASYYFRTDGTVQRFGMIHRGASVMPIDELELWSQIDYFPMIKSFIDSGNSGNANNFLDIDNYAFMSKRQYRVFNDICTKSIYKADSVQISGGSPESLKP